MRIALSFITGILFSFSAAVSSAAGSKLHCNDVFAPFAQRAASTHAYQILEFKIRPEFETLRKYHSDKLVEVAPHTLEMMSLIVARARQVPTLYDSRVVGTGENFSDADVSKWVKLSFRLATDGNHDGLLSPALALYALAGLLPQESGGSYVTTWRGSDRFIEHVSMEFLLPRLMADSEKAIQIVRQREAKRRLAILDGLVSGMLGQGVLTEEMQHVRDYFISHEFHGLKTLNRILLERARTPNSNSEPEDSTGGLGWAIRDYDERLQPTPNPFYKVHLELKKLGYTDKSIAALNEMETILRRQKRIGKMPEWMKWEIFRGHDITYDVDPYYWR